MEYTVEKTINLPREKTVALFDDPDNLPKWQPGLRSFDLISGERGQPGAKSRLVFDTGKRKMEMIETITARNLPDEFSAIYETKGVRNISRHYFFEDEPGKTRWVNENEFYFSGMMKIVALFMRSAFPKQTAAFMDDFKTFAENAE